MKMYLLGQILCTPFRKISLIALLSILPSLAFAQKTVTIVENNVPLKQVFAKIESQTGYSFAYNQSKIDTSRRVSLSLRNSDIHAVLTAILRGTGCGYKISGKYIVLVFPTTRKDEVELPVLAQTAKAKPTESVKSKPVIQPEQKVEEVEAIKTPLPPLEGNVISIEFIPAVIWPDTIDGRLRSVLTNQSGELIETVIQNRKKRNSPLLAAKTNLLYWATSTPNIGMEIALGKKWSLDATFGINPWSFKDNGSLKHWVVSPELRYWFCKPFERHFLGLHAMYGNYNVGNISFISALENNIYEGSLYGGGLTYGYHFPLKGRWGMELNIGLGFLRLQHDKYKCKDCNEKLGRFKENYLGPTKAGVSLIYVIN